MIKKWLSILFVSAVIFACNKQEIKQYPLVYDYGYFPLDSGIWKQYDVTYIEIDVPSNAYDTVRYQLREELTGWFLDAANDSMMRIERLYRSNSASSWQSLGIWQAGVKEGDAFQIEENMKFLKIKFPVTLNYDWDGNIYNRIDTLNEYQYTVTSFDVPEVVNSLSFDSVLTVTQKYKISIIDKVHFFEKFAYGVGLIDKQQVDIYSDDVDASIPIEKRVTKGTLYYQSMTSYGKN